MYQCDEDTRYCLARFNDKTWYNQNELSSDKHALVLAVSQPIWFILILKS